MIELLKEDMTRHEIKSLGTCNQMFINYILGNPIVFCLNFSFFSLVYLVTFIGQPTALYSEPLFQTLRPSSFHSHT